MQFLKTFVSAVVMLGLTGTAMAGQTTFNGTSDSNWSNASNWSNGLPDLDDKAIISVAVTVNISNAQAGVLDVDETVTINGSNQLEIDGDYLNESKETVSEASDVASGKSIVLTGTAPVLKVSGSTTINGASIASNIDGAVSGAVIKIAATKTLTSAILIKGQMTIEGLVSGSDHGMFVNNGTVNANATSGTMLVHQNTVLQSGTGLWLVSAQSSAVLQFDSGSACGTEIGNLRVSTGTLQVEAGVTFDDFDWDGGTLDSAVGSVHLRYDSYSGSKTNPVDGTETCGATYDYVDQYPNT